MRHIVGFMMRIVAYAFAVLAIGTITSGPVAAQCHGPECEDGRSGPPRYFTDRPPADGPRQNFDRPPYDGPRPRSDRPPVRGEPPRDDEPRFDPGNAQPRPWPAASEPRERRPEPAYRSANPSNPSEAYRRFWDERDDRRPRTTASPPPRRAEPPQRLPDRRMMDGRNGSGSGKVTITTAEYRALQDQARELQRLLAARRDVRERGDDRERGDYRERRDFHERERGDHRDMRPGSGPPMIYR